MVAWQISGSYLEACNCEAICPCRRIGGRAGGRSSFGECLGALSWLVTEGRARAAVRLIQDARKQAGFDVSDRINVRYAASDGLADVFEEHAAYIRREASSIGVMFKEDTRR